MLYCVRTIRMSPDTGNGGLGEKTSMITGPDEMH